MSISLDSLFSGSLLRPLAAGESLFLAGDEVAFVYRVRSGRIALNRTTPQGTVLLLQTARDGDVLAEASAYSGRYHCDATALEQCAVEAVTKAEFGRALSTSRDLAEAWERRLAHAVQDARMKSEIRTLRTVAERLDVWLSATGALPPKGRWQELASELGVSREALYRELARRSRQSVA
ncbi:Crp/Fnr family transcriptional regulator [Oricola sp.]|uniref:Crp/Fnr family transcriptional regulator n=1 Tax=Oricola sp. TaxID=1979950 RepID=UPI00320BDAA8|nr:Crp/Fnr family transcriptional regulator [Oricola sp.]